MRGRIPRRLPWVMAASLLGVGPLAAQQIPPETGVEPEKREASAQAAPEEGPRFRLGGEIKTHYRSSKSLEITSRFPFPPSFRPGGDPTAPVLLRTVSPERSFEVSTATLRGEGELSSGVAAKVEVHFLDLYNRNPTSSDDRIFVREAWLRLGRQPAPLRPAEGSSAYVLVGMAPRFSKQVIRRMESYGLWGTAVGRFEQPQLQVGGVIGGHFYWRGMVGNGNPLFIRDPNALAGDNGTPERVPGNVNPIYQSGFPIFYDAKPQDLNPAGRFEWGAGLGLRAGSDRSAIEVLGWYFTRQLEEVTRLRGTFYSGDIKLLRGAGVPLPFEGTDKRELGLNVEGRLGGGRLFAQYVDQEFASLPRRGVEVELAWNLELGGLFAMGDTPVGNWIQPVVRVSIMDIRFETPRQYPSVTVGWDWRKYDFGLRVGLVPDVDLTLEYARHDAILFSGAKFHPDEFLATLRAGF